MPTLRSAGGVLGASLAAILLAGCTSSVAEPIAPPSGEPTPSVADPSLLVGRGLVLDDGSGPEFCLGGINTSDPPQCGGPPLVGWTWPTAGVERRAGVTFGAFVLVGRYAGGRFTVERQVTEQEAAASFPAVPKVDLDSPCPEPAGGWRPVDPDRSGDAEQQAVFALAAELPGYGGSFVDDRGNHAQPPETTVVNVRVTGDVTAAEERLREVWGGPLCVSTARFTEAERHRIQDESGRGTELLSSGSVLDQVEIRVVYDDGSLQRRLDQRYGAGVVRVDSALQPFRG